ncbi:hypothetical protein D3C76_882900 [compost metagenome]
MRCCCRARRRARHERSFRPPAQGAHRPGCRLGRRSRGRPRRAPAQRQGHGGRCACLLGAPAGLRRGAAGAGRCGDRSGNLVLPLSRILRRAGPQGLVAPAGTRRRASPAPAQRALFQWRGTLLDGHGAVRRRRPGRCLPDRRGGCQSDPAGARRPGQLSAQLVPWRPARLPPALLHPGRTGLPDQRRRAWQGPFQLRQPVGARAAGGRGGL